MTLYGKSTAELYAREVHGEHAYVGARPTLGNWWVAEVYDDTRGAGRRVLEDAEGKSHARAYDALARQLGGRACVQRAVVIADHGDAGRVLVPVGPELLRSEYEEQEAAAYRREGRVRALETIARSGRHVHVALVGCGKRKATTRCPARSLYTGSLFRAALRHAEATSDVVWIMSGLHGLVELEAPLEPYDVTLRAGEAYLWAADVVAALGRELGAVPYDVDVYAGGAYGAALVAASQGMYREPCRGLTLGGRLAYFRRERERRASR